MKTLNNPGKGSAYAWTALVLYTAACFLPLYELRPNRIASGVAAGLIRAPLALAAVTAAAVLLVVALLAKRSGAERPGLSPARLPGLPRLAAYASWIVSSLALLALPLASSGFRGFPGTTASYARASPAAGFWLFLLAALLGSLWSSARAAPGGRVKLAWNALLLLALVGFGLGGFLDRFSPYMELRSQGPRFWAELLRHISLSVTSFTVALILGILGAVALSRGRKMGRVLAGLAGAVQNIPSLALFGILLPIMAGLARAFPLLRGLGISGIGTAPALIALIAYALLPVMLAGSAGLRMVDPVVKDAARGMGMSKGQMLLRVELPLALPILAAGARTALVQTIGTTTVAALIGAGGMGYFVFQGVGQAAMDMVILGVAPVVLLSLGADRAMAALERRTAGKTGANPWH